MKEAQAGHSGGPLAQRPIANARLSILSSNTQCRPTVPLKNEGACSGYRDLNLRYQTGLEHLVHLPLCVLLPSVCQVPVRIFLMSSVKTKTMNLLTLSSIASS